MFSPYIQSTIPKPGKKSAGSSHNTGLDTWKFNLHIQPHPLDRYNRKLRNRGPTWIIVSPWVQGLSTHLPISRVYPSPVWIVITWAPVVHHLSPPRPKDDLRDAQVTTLSLQGRLYRLTRKIVKHRKKLHMKYFIYKIPRSYVK